MPARQAITPPDLKAGLRGILDEPTLPAAFPAGQIANLASQHGYPMTSLCQIAREFMVARPAGLVQSRKGLMNQEDVHFKDPAAVPGTPASLLGGPLAQARPNRS